ncbi:MAG TPA: metallophosphoesterase, partial [Candidatus Tectomicrobia bacterium]
YYRFSWDHRRRYRRLVKQANGVFTLLASDAVPYRRGQAYRVVITALGTRLQVSIDDQLIFDVSDSSLAHGPMALYSRANTGSRFAHVVVDNPQAGTVLFRDDFTSGSLANWTIVDDSSRSGPSRWTIQAGTLVQLADIYGANNGLDMLGTYALSKAGRLQVPANFRVAFIGDTGAGSNFRSVLQLIKNQGAHMVLHQGDLGYLGTNTLQWEAVVNEVLGTHFPYFASAGNHDRDWSRGYGPLLAARARRVGAACTGTYGLNAACYYHGLSFILSAAGETGSETRNAQYIKDQFAHDHSLWRICSWHRNQRLMQIGGKHDEVGWGPYEACREAGAIIATAHEHTYSRTHLMANFRTQTIASTSLQIEPGKSFAFVSALGGRDIRDQELDGPWWASIYTSTQGATYGALFCTFNVEGAANQASCYFMDIAGHIPDQFAVRSAVQEAQAWGLSTSDTCCARTAPGIAGPPRVSKRTQRGNRPPLTRSAQSPDQPDGANLP